MDQLNEKYSSMQSIHYTDSYLTEKQDASILYFIQHNEIIEYTLKQKWRWASHIVRMKDNRWTKHCTEWQPRRGKRSRG